MYEIYTREQFHKILKYIDTVLRKNIINITRSTVRDFMISVQ